MSYQIAVLHDAPGTIYARDVRDAVNAAVSNLGLASSVGVWAVGPMDRTPPTFGTGVPTAVLYTAGPGPTAAQRDILSEGLAWDAVLPVVASGAASASQLPATLRAVNGVTRASALGAAAAAAGRLLELVGLLREARKVFISYRRSDGVEAAKDLYAKLDGLQYDVFLDSSGLPPGTAFERLLRRRVTDADVLVLLLTADADAGNGVPRPWLLQEFQWALAARTSVVRVLWPGVPAWSGLGYATRYDWNASWLDAVADIVEDLRARSQLARRKRLTRSLLGFFPSLVRDADGSLRSPSGAPGKLVQPVVGHPGSSAFEAVAGQAADTWVAYDDLGMEPAQANHLLWLGEGLKRTKGVAAMPLSGMATHSVTRGLP